MKGVRDTREKRETDVGCTMTSMVIFTGSSTKSAALACARWARGEGEGGGGGADRCLHPPPRPALRGGESCGWRGGEEERAEVRGVRDTREERETDGELWRD